MAALAISVPLTHTSALPTTPLTMSFAFCPAGGAAKSVRYHQGTENCAIVSAPTLVICPKQVFMLVEKNTFGHAPFCSSALISVPGAPAPSLVRESQPLVEKPGVEIWAPPCVAVALVSTFQPAAPRSTTALDPVDGAEPEAGAAAVRAVGAAAPNALSCASSPTMLSATTAASSFLLLMAATSWDGMAQRDERSTLSEQLAVDSFCWLLGR